MYRYLNFVFVFVTGNWLMNLWAWFNKAVVFTSYAGAWCPQWAYRMSKNSTFWRLTSRLEPPEWTQILFAPVGFDFTDEYVLQKLGPFIRGLNPGTWPQSWRHWRRIQVGNPVAGLDVVWHQPSESADRQRRVSAAEWLHCSCSSFVHPSSSTGEQVSPFIRSWKNRARRLTGPRRNKEECELLNIRECNCGLWS